MIKRPNPWPRLRARILALALAIGLTSLAFAARAQDQPPEKKTTASKPTATGRAGSTLKSWAELRAGLKNYPAQQLDRMKQSILSLRIVRRPHTVLQGYEPEPALWQGLTGFYDFIKGRELDMYTEQPGIPEFFPTRDAYYDFLDTIIPAMRDRAFERNRLLAYRIHEIKTTGADADVTISITSDDSLRLGKYMVFHQRWSSLGLRWYPGKISAEPATIWERVK
jgi:hypothetical protein